MTISDTSRKYQSLLVGVGDGKAVRDGDFFAGRAYKIRASTFQIMSRQLGIASTQFNMLGQNKCK